MSHRRAEDAELLGFLVPHGELFVPVTVFGYALGDSLDRTAAEHVLESSGLSCLAGRWRLRLDDQSVIAVEIIEAAPERVVVQSVGSGERFTLTTPIEEDRLAMR